MKVAIYTRVSTNEQTTENQKLELLKVCKQRNWTVVEMFEDFAISGAKGRNARPALNKMWSRAMRGEFDLIAAWSVDRLGRSLTDLISFLNDLSAANVGLYLHQQALDTTTPSGRAMFQMVGVFAEFERAMIQARVKTGLARARAEGIRLGAEPRFDEYQRREIQFAVAMGESVSKIAERNRCSRQTIYRIRDEEVAAICVESRN